MDSNSWHPMMKMLMRTLSSLKERWLFCQTFRISNKLIFLNIWNAKLWPCLKNYFNACYNIPTSSVWNINLVMKHRNKKPNSFVKTKKTMKYFALNKRSPQKLKNKFLQQKWCSRQGLRSSRCRRFLAGGQEWTESADLSSFCNAKFKIQLVV